MTNFKGGFAFNNEAAKVEVEQAPDGTLISCVNPVTGESLGGGGGGDFTTAHVTVKNINATMNCTISVPMASTQGCTVNRSVNKNTEVELLVPLYNGAATFRVSSGFVIDDFTGEYEGYTGEESGTIKGDCSIKVEYD